MGVKAGSTVGRWALLGRPWAYTAWVSVGVEGELVGDCNESHGDEPESVCVCVLDE